MGILLFTLCRITITYLRKIIPNRIIPLDNIHVAHRVLAWSIMAMTLVHIIGHYWSIYNVRRLIATTHRDNHRGHNGYNSHNNSNDDTLMQILLHPASLTGHAMLIIILLMAFTSFAYVRKRNYEMFSYTHQLYMAFIPLLLLHGAFCFLKSDQKPECSTMGGTFWHYGLPGLVWYIGERIYIAVYHSRSTTILGVYEHPSQVIEIHVARPPNFHYGTGQWAYLSVAEASPWQKHPFTITSAPEEKDHICFHIRVVGDWTQRLAAQLNCSLDITSPFSALLRSQATSTNNSSAVSNNGISNTALMPPIQIDGPYGAVCDHVLDYKVAVLVAGGIGVTPFVSTLKSIWLQWTNASHEMKLKKVYFIWICRDFKAFEWFYDLLATLEDGRISSLLSMRIYVTGQLDLEQIWNVAMRAGHNEDALTGWHMPTFYGRPNFNVLFHDLTESHPQTDIGLFCCGPHSLTATLRRHCQRYTLAKGSGTRFYFHKGKRNENELILDTHTFVR
ncbi:ferric reductase NAD binding domain-containing protein [Syncephalis fuscata]|nr:ferric reductase NAD binding domain-containing protein [Syncephalis fuscata]